jgi:hypothetical protein
MSRDKIIRSAIFAGIVLLIVLIMVAIGAPMIDMIRAHLGL